MYRIGCGALILALVASIGAGCGGEQATGAGPDTAPETSASPATSIAVPDTLAFQAQTLDGEQLDATTLAGRPVALWFWAAWCAHCAHAAHEIKAIQEEYAGTAHVLGVAGLGSGEDGMQEFVTEHELDSSLQLADDEGEVWRRFGVTTMEYYVVLDASGAVAHEGHFDVRALRDQLSALVD